MTRFILLLLCITYSIPSFSLTANDLVREYALALKHCVSVGFYNCENDRFISDGGRGVFYKPIQIQHVRLMEQRYETFVKEKYPENYILSSLVKATMDFNSVPDFDLNPYSPSNIVGIDTMNADKTIFKFTFKQAPPIFLAHDGNGYKIAIHPDEQKAAKKTKEYKTAYLAMLKANILRYHIIEAELLNHDRSTLNLNINEAMAPLVQWAQGDKMPELVKKFIKRDAKEIRKFYGPIYTDEQARKIVVTKMNK